MHRPKQLPISWPISCRDLFEVSGTSAISGIWNHDVGNCRLLRLRARGPNLKGSQYSQLKASGSTKKAWYFSVVSYIQKNSGKLWILWKDCSWGHRIVPTDSPMSNQRVFQVSILGIVILVLGTYLCFNQDPQKVT